MLHQKLLLPASGVLFATLVACGGKLGDENVSTTNSGSGNPVTPPSSGKPPTIKMLTPTAPVITETNYGIAFQAKGEDPDIGDKVVKYVWDFGDGQAPQEVDPAADLTSSMTHTFTGTVGENKSFNVTVKAKDQSGNLSTSPASVTVTIPQDAGAKGSIIADPELKIAPSEALTLHAQVDPKSLLDKLTAQKMVWDFGDGSPLEEVDLSKQADGAVAHSFAKAGKYSVKVAVVNSLKNQGPSSLPVTINVDPQYTNIKPAITVIEPSQTSASIWTSKELSLSFYLKDSNNDTVTYTVDWGDGKKETASVSNTSEKEGSLVKLKHVYADTFTPQTVKVSMNATDNRANGDADAQSRDITVSYNTLPTAQILTPQASGTLPVTMTGIDDGGQGLPTLPVGSTDVDVVVIPAGGKVRFNGTGIAPASGGNISYSWRFPGGTPTSSTEQSPKDEVVYAGVPGKTVAYKVDLTVTDEMNRTSQNAVKAHQKWIIVDGLNTQTFNMNFMYRQRSDVSAEILTKVKTAPNGLNAKVGIIQDGMRNEYQMNNGKDEAEISLPVRSDLPFYIEINNFGSDNTTYLFRIPYKPGIDPDLAATNDFSFQNTSHPWNPRLSLVTSTGFAEETAIASQGVLNGTWNHWEMPVTTTPLTNVRWLSRLSAPSTDPLGAIKCEEQNTVNHTFAGLYGYCNFSEWIIYQMMTPLSGATAKDMSLVLDYEKYVAGDPPADAQPTNPPSANYATTHLGAFRVPPSVTVPYLLDQKANTTGEQNVVLSPKEVDPNVKTQLGTMLFKQPGDSPLKGGLNGLPVYYKYNDPDRIPRENITMPYNTTRQTFSYGEFLWSRAWARPLVLNRANVGWYDMFINKGEDPTNYFKTMGSFFNYSNPNLWPQLGGITGAKGDTAFDLTVKEGNDFNPNLSPATDASGVMPPQGTQRGIGRFFWTAYTPIYSPVSGSLISRTWRADTTKQIPIISTADSKEPTPAWGFTVPLDPVVDKRGRTAKGVLDGNPSGGYRVNWFNPTRNGAGQVVPPDFWVVVLEAEGKNHHFLLPGNFPAAEQSPSDAILTDARAFLPSGNKIFDPTRDTVGPGYCWFDIPVELRPQKTNSAYITIFAVRSIVNGQDVSLCRRLNRTEWFESIKTFAPDLLTTLGSGLDMSYGHKLALKYPWDVVIANSPRVEVKP